MYPLIKSYQDSLNTSSISSSAKGLLSYFNTVLCRITFVVSANYISSRTYKMVRKFHLTHSSFLCYISFTYSVNRDINFDPIQIRLTSLSTWMLLLRRTLHEFSNGRKLPFLSCLSIFSPWTFAFRNKIRVKTWKKSLTHKSQLIWERERYWDLLRSFVQRSQGRIFHANL